MSRPFQLKPLSGKDLLRLQHLIRAPGTSADLYRRYLLIWQLAAGYNIREAAQIANLHYTNAHKWVTRFQSQGLAGLVDRQRPGRPKIHNREIEKLVIKTATSPPSDLGLEFTTWSLAKLEQYLRRQSGSFTISREAIRHILSRHGVRLVKGQP